MYLLVICKSLGKCLFFFVFVFLLFSCMHFLIYILGINPYVTCDLKISSLICTLFSFFNVSFAGQRLFSLMQSHLLTLLWWLVFLVVI